MPVLARCIWVVETESPTMALGPWVCSSHAEAIACCHEFVDEDLRPTRDDDLPTAESIAPDSVGHAENKNVIHLSVYSFDDPLSPLWRALAKGLFSRENLKPTNPGRQSCFRSGIKLAPVMDGRDSNATRARYTG